MHRETCFAFAVGILFVLVQEGHSLQCWKCSSEHDVTCKDYFNKTNIEINRKYFENSNYGNRQIQPVRTEPHLEPCDDMYTDGYKQKNVCLKSVYKGTNGIPIVIRGCRLVAKSQNSADCPEELIDKTKVLQSCLTCEKDECNDGNAIKNNVLIATVVPTLVVLFLRK